MQPVSRLPQAPVTADALLDATRLLEAVAEDRTLLDALSEPQRKALLAAAGRIAHPERDDVHRLRKHLKSVRKREDEARRARDRAIRERTTIREVRQQPVFVAPPLALPASTRPPGPRLETPRHCYVCKADYLEVHHFYDAMCPSCGDFNYARRFPTARLDGQVALVTGGRVKIGQQAALMLLRAGARVVVTTRFPHDAALRYAREPGFDEWGHRLEVHGLDLRHSPSVELFARWLSRHLPRLDMLISNAAQTVRRPTGFYAHLMPVEEAPLASLPADARSLLAGRQACLAAMGAAPALDVGATDDVTGLARWHAGRLPGAGLVTSARASQVRYTWEDASYGMEVFPDGRLDADLQQVDLRAVNSWRLKLHEVSTPELLEVYLVNAVAPFVLAGRLRALMRSGPPGHKHVVNVSAMEGSFSRGTRTDRHPHTNMAKAALNMMTATSAPDYAKDGIWMNAVDTGWVTDEDPAQHAARKKDELGFQPPLDIVDGAARVVDPVFATARGEAPMFGRFLKDYRVVPW